MWGVGGAEVTMGNRKVPRPAPGSACKPEPPLAARRSCSPDPPGRLPDVQVPPPPPKGRHQTQLLEVAQRAPFNWKKELLGKIEATIIENTGDGPFAAYVVEWLREMAAFRIAASTRPILESRWRRKEAVSESLQDARRELGGILDTMHECSWHQGALTAAKAQKWYVGLEGVERLLQIVAIPDREEIRRKAFTEVCVLIQDHFERGEEYSRG